MKRFLRNIATIALSALILLIIADVVFTQIYSSAAPTEKIALLRTHKGEKIPYVFVGSSRVNVSVIPSVIEKRTGKSALNLGINSVRPRDVLTMVKLLQAYKIKTDTIFVQVDYGFNHYDGSPEMEYQVLPFLWEDAAFREHIDHLPNAFALKYVPFFRYAAYDQKIGFRKLLKSMGETPPSDLEKSDGYMMRKGQHMLPEYELPKTINHRNIYQEKLDAFAKKHRISIVYFTSPFSTSVNAKDYMAKLKTKIPGIHDYAESVKVDSLFSNRSHLNHDGAVLFTNLLVDDFWVQGAGVQGAGSR